MIHPIDKVYITQEFGERPSVYKQFGMAGHNGIDYRTRFTDSPLGRRYIVAALDGKVTEARYNKGGYGWFVRLEHDGGAQTIYGHNTKLYVAVGQHVKQGDRIALSGNTGFSSGPHLHFGYRPRGWQKNYDNGFKGYVDPMPYLRGDIDVGQETPEYDDQLVRRLIKKGLCMLIVPEWGGETWYLSPKTLKRYKTGHIAKEDAAIFAKDGAWLGINAKDIKKIEEA